MKILVVNDDGINAPGLEALAGALSTVADVTVIAPLRQYSGASSAITVNTILKVHKTYKNDAFFGYAVDGTPADCVKLGLQDLMDEKPDYVFSGINSGANLSSDVHYSGTVAAAYEGISEGITSCAVSLSTWNVEYPNFVPAAAVALRWLETMRGSILPCPVLYNLNVPPLPLSELKGIMPAQLTGFSFNMNYEKRKAPNGHDYYWLAETGSGRMDTDVEGSDFYWLKRGYVSVTPLMRGDPTAWGLLDKMKDNGPTPL